MSFARQYCMSFARQHHDRFVTFTIDVTTQFAHGMNIVPTDELFATDADVTWLYHRQFSGSRNQDAPRG